MSDNPKDKFPLDETKMMAELLQNPLILLELVTFSILYSQSVELVVGQILEEAGIATREEVATKIAQAIKDLQQAVHDKSNPLTDEQKKKDEADKATELLKKLPDSAFGKLN